MLSERSDEKELIDLGPDYYTAEEYQHCLKMLFRVNKLLGFYAGTRKILSRFATSSSLLDVGCGGGLFLLHLSQHFPTMQFTGIDISSTAIDIAKQELQSWQKTHSVNHVSFQVQEQENLEILSTPVDIVLATLVCHHLTDDELVGFLQKTLAIAQHAVIINDLHRHPLTHALYRVISPVLFRNRLITHDGLISIRRGFTRNEWILLLQKAGVHHYQLTWCFPFRWRLILWKKSSSWAEALQD